MIRVKVTKIISQIERLGLGPTAPVIENSLSVFVQLRGEWLDGEATAQLTDDEEAQVKQLLRQIEQRIARELGGERDA